MIRFKLYKMVFTFCFVAALTGCTSTSHQSSLNSIDMAEMTDLESLLTSAWQYKNGKDHNTWIPGSHPQDLEKAKGLYLKARMLGSGKASLELYRMSESEAEKKELLIEAAERGNKTAIETLAQSYFGGWSGFEQNAEKGEVWAEIARKNYLSDRKSGSGEASYKLYELEFPGTAHSKELLLEAVDRGYAKASSELAMNYLMGKKGFEQDPDKAESFAKQVLAAKPQNYSEKLAHSDARSVIKQLPGVKSKFEREQKAQLEKRRSAELKRQDTLCREAKESLFTINTVGDAQILRLQTIVDGCYGTITATKDKTGKWNGPYKIVGNKDGFVYVDGNMKNGVFSGEIYAKGWIPRVHNFYEDKGTGTFVLRAKQTIDADAAMNSGFDMFDYQFSHENHGKLFTKKVSVRDNHLVEMIEYMDDETTLYKGTVLSIGWIYFNLSDYYDWMNKGINVEKKDPTMIHPYHDDTHNVIHIPYSNYGRLEGQCRYENAFEPCKYEYFVSIKDSAKYKRYKRTDSIGQERRKQYRALLDLQIKGLSDKYNRSVAKWKAEDRKEAQKEQESAARQARDKANRERWAREDAEYQKRIDNDAAQMFNNVFGSTSLSSSNDINDPLNPNNPINRNMQEQVNRSLNQHYQKQEQEKRDYEAEVAQRQREIDAQKEAQRRNTSYQSDSTSGLSGPGSTRYSTPTSTHDQFMTSVTEDEYATGRDGWDCTQQWRADKCGERMTTHTIHWQGRNVTDGQGNYTNIPMGSDDSHSSNNSNAGGTGSSSGSGNTVYSGSDEYGENGEGGGAQDPGVGESVPVNPPKQLIGDSEYYYRDEMSVDLAQTDLMNQANKYCGTAYKTRLEWHDALTGCKQLGKEYRCKVQATVTCLAESCGSRFCGTIR